MTKRAQGKGLGVFATSRGISVGQLAAYYPCKLIRDPGPSSGHPLEAYFVEVEQDDTLVGRPFSAPAHRQPCRGIPFNGWFVNEGKDVPVLASILTCTLALIPAFGCV